MTTLEQRVRGGIRILNKKIPGWFNRINLDTLNISSNKNCILGQLGHTSVTAMLDFLGAGDEVEVPRILAPLIAQGFSPNYLTSCDEPYSHNDSVSLNEVWKKGILALRRKEE